jgi:hypothetical protein
LVVSWLARLFKGVASRGPGRSGTREPDPFVALRLQTRLGVLAEQIRAIEADQYLYAKAHRLAVTKAAYDDLLEEACRLAGVDVSGAAGRGGDEARRSAEELELAARGWNW